MQQIITCMLTEKVFVKVKPIQVFRKTFQIMYTCQAAEKIRQFFINLVIENSFPTNHYICLVGSKLLSKNIFKGSSGR